MILKNDQKLADCLCYFTGQRYFGEDEHMFSQLAILDYLQKDQEIEERDLVWTMDLYY